jgi:DNA-binding helix-hairpin-helix protein with protein kinase domain
MHWINAEHNYSVTGLDCPEVTVEHEDGKSGVLGSDDVVVFVFEGDLDD